MYKIWFDKIQIKISSTIHKMLQKINKKIKKKNAWINLTESWHVYHVKNLQLIINAFYIMQV
jgi:hypothetical protein